MNAPATTYTVPVPEHKAGTRLDRLLAQALPELSRTRIKALILEGRVTRSRDGASVLDPAGKAEAGGGYVVTVPPPAPADPAAESLPLVVVYEDEHLLVIDKPAGMVVHPAPGSPAGTLVNALLAHCRGSLSGIGGVGRPGIVHRLDKDTSGLMVVAKNDAAHRGLAAQFAEHTLERAYRAVVWGVPRPGEGEIEGNIGRDPRNRKKMAVVAAGGKPALTRYRLLRPVGTLAGLVECRLATGRTHQIRVHLASIGHPVVGDPLYGTVRARRAAGAAVTAVGAGFRRQALHAFVIGFWHPIMLKWLRFESELPNDIKDLSCMLDAI